MCSSCASVTVQLIVLVLIIAFNLKLIFPSFFSCFSCKCYVSPPVATFAPSPMCSLQFLPLIYLPNVLPNLKVVCKKDRIYADVCEQASLKGYKLCSQECITEIQKGPRGKHWPHCTKNLVFWFFAGFFCRGVGRGRISCTFSST